MAILSRLASLKARANSLLSIRDEYATSNGQDPLSEGRAVKHRKIRKNILFFQECLGLNTSSDKNIFIIAYQHSLIIVVIYIVIKNYWLRFAGLF